MKKIVLVLMIMGLLVASAFAATKIPIVCGYEIYSGFDDKKAKYIIGNFSQAYKPFIGDELRLNLNGKCNYFITVNGVQTAGTADKFITHVFDTTNAITEIIVTDVENRLETNTYTFKTEGTGFAGYFNSIKLLEFKMGDRLGYRYKPIMSGTLPFDMQDYSKYERYENGGLAVVLPSGETYKIVIDIKDKNNRSIYEILSKKWLFDNAMHDFRGLSFVDSKGEVVCSYKPLEYNGAEWNLVKITEYADLYGTWKDVMTGNLVTISKSSKKDKILIRHSMDATRNIEDDGNTAKANVDSVYWCWNNDTVMKAIYLQFDRIQCKPVLSKDKNMMGLGLYCRDTPYDQRMNGVFERVK
jgi:hypothetical protein